MLDGLMFDYLLFSPFSVTVVFVRAYVSVHPHISYVVAMHVSVKGYVFEFIGRRRMNNWMVLCDLQQDLFQFDEIYKTHMPHANVMKKVWWEGIQMCTIFVVKIIFSWASGSFKGGWVDVWVVQR